MSLTIKRVENISRKKRKSGIIITVPKKDSLEDDASKFVVIEDFYLENFPPLRPVYRKDIMGTPIVFRITNGIDYYGELTCNVFIHSITFMKEYKSKSFEELRWEDYSLGRKQILHYEENSYLNCLFTNSTNKKIIYEFFDPAPKNIPNTLEKQKSLSSFGKYANSKERDLCKSPNASKSICYLNSQAATSKIGKKPSDYKNDVQNPTFRNSLESTGNLEKEIITSKILKPRSILTHVDKSETIKVKNNNLRSITEVNSGYKGVSSRQEYIEMIRSNLVRYFEKADAHAHIPYDFLTQNTKFYLPCAEIGFVYQNARPSSKVNGSALDSLRNLATNQKSVLTERDLGLTRNTLLKQENILQWKYNSKGKFRKQYFYNHFCFYERPGGTKTISRGKYILSGQNTLF
ncbi:uncharacterized protein [Diabrotica undecimpunctata]|uniref:uncharacterized protein n=1 Tax=Diabrotica undecimpunctata TaxID=50387 RepID=UPI003B6321E0